MSQRRQLTVCHGDAAMSCLPQLMALYIPVRYVWMQGLVRQRVFGPQLFGRAPDEAKVAEALEGLDTTLQVLDQRLATNKYLAGGR